MSSITTFTGSTALTTADLRVGLNTNFSNLNTDKIETSVIDTDTSLTANSDAKIPTQKAVKAYVDAGGNVNASTTSKGIVEEATQAEVNAGTAAGGTGARLFINPSTLASYLSTGNYISKVASGQTTKDMSSTTTTNLAHGLGVTPKLVVFVGNAGATGQTTGQVMGVISGGVTIAQGFNIDAGTNTGSFLWTSFVLCSVSGGSTYISAAVTVDATNLTFTWNKTGSPTGTANIMWYALA